MSRVILKLGDCVWHLGAKLDFIFQLCSIPWSCRVLMSQARTFERAGIFPVITLSS